MSLNPLQIVTTLKNIKAVQLEIWETLSVETRQELLSLREHYLEKAVEPFSEELEMLAAVGILYQLPGGIFGLESAGKRLVDSVTETWVNKQNN